MNENQKRKIRTIYLDDETIFLKALGEYMETQGLEVTTHSDPNDAICDMQVNKDNYDLALIDFRMPGTTGAHVLREMADNDFFGIPFVALYSTMPTMPEVDEAFARLDLDKYKIRRITKELQDHKELPEFIKEIEETIWKHQ